MLLEALNFLYLNSVPINKLFTKESVEQEHEHQAVIDTLEILVFVARIDQNGTFVSYIS